MLEQLPPLLAKCLPLGQLLLQEPLPVEREQEQQAREQEQQQVREREQQQVREQEHWQVQAGLELVAAPQVREQGRVSPLQYIRY